MTLNPTLEISTLLSLSHSTVISLMLLGHAHSMITYNIYSKHYTWRDPCCRAPDSQIFKKQTHELVKKEHELCHVCCHFLLFLSMIFGVKEAFAFDLPPKMMEEKLDSGICCTSKLINLISSQTLIGCFPLLYLQLVAAECIMLLHLRLTKPTSLESTSHTDCMQSEKTVLLNRSHYTSSLCRRVQ